MCFFYCCVVILLYFIYAPLWACFLPLRTRSAVSGYLTSDVLGLADASSAWTSLDSASRTILHQRIATDINGHKVIGLIRFPLSFAELKTSQSHIFTIACLPVGRLSWRRRKLWRWWCQRETAVVCNYLPGRWTSYVEVYQVQAVLYFDV